MKATFFKLILSSFGVALILAFAFKSNVNNRLPELKGKARAAQLFRCGPDWEQLATLLEEVDIPPIPGAGSYKWKISTDSDSAQFYFNQGINMYYSFHIIEAIASFKKAASFDPSCAMLEWAQALAYGPNINDVGYAASPDALRAIGRAGELAGGVTTNKEKMLIRAQAARYSADSMASRETLNQLYVDEMQRVYDTYPDDADIAALYADALMLQHPWNLWNIDGTPKRWTPRIREVLEKLLAKSPNHPGANHYYIHVMEPSPYAAKALPSADRLGKLTPGLSHTVHMPSHIYLRTGNYTKGVSVNEAAINSYRKTVPLFAPVNGADFLYLIHNLHMQTNHAMMAGRLAYSVKSAQETLNSIPDNYLSTPGAPGNFTQHVHMTPVLVDIRFGRWDEILGRSQPDPSQVYSSLLNHFARGMALANKQDLTSAGKELDRMRELMKDSSLAIPFTPFSAAIEGARVAEQLLLGTIQEERKMYVDAIRHFSIADSIEINMVYDEPRDWLLSPKHFLGNAYIKAGQWKNAENTFRKDLLYNNENGWGLYGLYQALMGQKRKAEADKIMARYKKAFEKSDIKLTAAVY